jgi:2-polyprenyl-6-hydroxyphenyl methylase/3-demethylubiquinone-9 3-methyltransferase
VNDDEISHFSRLSALWWDERGEFALLHKMNPHRIRFIREKLLEVLQTQPDATTTATPNNTIPSNPTQSLESPRVLEGMDVLDVGCGGGILSEVCFISSFPLLTDIVAHDCNRVSRVSAPIRSPSTHRQRTSASRRVMQLRILVSRAMQHPRRHRGH